MKNIILQTYESPCGSLLLGSFGEELCLCDWRNGRDRTEIDLRLARVLDADFVEGSSEVIGKAHRELDEYFAGQRKEFDVPLLIAGTEFQQLVWGEVMKVNYGATITYGSIAKLIDDPKAVRAIANAIGANALSIFIPCHRVIGSDGSLTGYAGGLEAKKFLLDLEQENK